MILYTEAESLRISCKLDIKLKTQRLLYAFSERCCRYYPLQVDILPTSSLLSISATIYTGSVHLPFLYWLQILPTSGTHFTHLFFLVQFSHNLYWFCTFTIPVYNDSHTLLVGQFPKRMQTDTCISCICSDKIHTVVFQMLVKTLLTCRSLLQTQTNF